MRFLAVVPLVVVLGCNSSPLPFGDGGSGSDGSGGISCGNSIQRPCLAGEYCAFANFSCGQSDEVGSCVAKPVICPQYYSATCGCDGQTYANSCDANGHGVNVSHAGACSPSVDLANSSDGGGTICGGFAGFVCGSGEYCFYDLNSGCGFGDQSGVCRTIPPAEPCADHDFVCGCDGRTYASSCAAAHAGTSPAPCPV